MRPAVRGDAGYGELSGVSRMPRELRMAREVTLGEEERSLIDRRSGDYSETSGPMPSGSPTVIPIRGFDLFPSLLILSVI
jgi:hypothetical protein